MNLSAPPHFQSLNSALHSWPFVYVTLHRGGQAHLEKYLKDQKDVTQTFPVGPRRSFIQLLKGVRAKVCLPSGTAVLCFGSKERSNNFGTSGGLHQAAKPGPPWVEIKAVSVRLHQTLKSSYLFPSREGGGAHRSLIVCRPADRDQQHLGGTGCAFLQGKAPAHFRHLKINFSLNSG